MESLGGTEPGCTPWSYTPTNFDVCALPAPGTLQGSVSGLTIDTDNLGSLGAYASTIAQSDGVHLVVLHLTDLEISGSWSTQGSAALVLAVDGAITIDPGAVLLVMSDSSDPLACTPATGQTLAGNSGAMSANSGVGGGGGGGGAGAGKGASGGNGDGAGHGNGGGMQNGVAMDVTPLHGGCEGGDGGSAGGTGTPGVGGLGGGALQFSTNTSIDVFGHIEAIGQGATLAATAKTGAGGGGGGGALVLEGPAIHVESNGVLCADGGSGGNGGGQTSTGSAGATSPCDGKNPAPGGDQHNNGGAGGDGGYATTDATTGAVGQGGSNAGGGGGGGGVGWIHLHQVMGMPTVDGGAVITPKQQ